jgi:hypothetical protein
MSTINSGITQVKLETQKNLEQSRCLIEITLLSNEFVTNTIFISTNHNIPF